VTLEKRITEANDKLKVTRGYDLKKHRLNHKPSKALDTINTHITKRFVRRNIKTIGKRGRHPST